MIKINLLPEEYKREQEEDENPQLNIARVFFYIGLGCLIILMGAGSFLIYLPLNTTETLFKEYNKELKKINLKYQEALRVQTEYDNLLKDNRNVEAFKKRILWAEKLNIISDVLNEQMQITLLDIKPRTEKVVVIEKIKEKVKGKIKIISKSVEKKRIFYTFDIEGKVVFVGGEDKVARFIENLNKDERFSQDFEYIKLISISVLDEKVKFFSVRCRFKPEIDDLLCV